MVKKNKILSKKVIGLTLGVTLFVTAGGMVYSQVNQNDKSDMPLVSREREYPVKRGDITAGTNGSGSIKLEGASQNFEQPVTIGEVFVKEGQLVNKGDKIASVSEDFMNEQLKELNSQLEQATASLNSAKNNKQATLLTQNKTWDDRVTASKTQYETQKQPLVNAIDEQTKKINEITQTLNTVRQQIDEISNRLETLKALEAQTESKEDENVENFEISEENQNLDTVEVEAKNASQEEEELKLQELKATEAALSEEKVAYEAELKNLNDQLNTLNQNRNQELEAEKKEAATNNQINSLSNGNLDDSIGNAQREVDKINEEISKINKLKANPILYAETDGIILSLNATPESMTTLEMPVVTIGESAKVLAQISLSQENIIKIEEGQKVYLTVPAYQDQKIEGTVKTINLKPEGQGNSVNYSVIVEVNETDLNLLEGMTVSAQFIVKEVKDTLMISNKAITIKDGKQVANVRQVDGTLKEVEVVTGFSDGKNSEIISGLIEGDTVVIGGN